MRAPRTLLDPSRLLDRPVRSCAQRLANALASALVFVALPLGAAAQARTAIVGATLIDGNGGPPLANATVIVDGGRIAAVGPSASITVPDGARVIDATGQFMTPGFVDTNVHTSLYGAGFGKHRKENAVFYFERGTEIALEAAQMHLKHGVTHIRDSYGQLPQLVEVRDAIARGAEVGPRMQVAGNIVGWGGAFSITFALIPEANLSLWEEQFSDHLAQGAGEDLLDMYPEELRVAINAYLDKGVDFLKYGGTSHWAFPTLISFSPEAQSVIVEEVHRRGLVVETHSTNPEGLRLSVEAGIDLIQHPEVLADREISDELVTQIRERGVICSMLANTLTGEAWQKHLTDRDAAQRRLAAADENSDWGRLRRPVERVRTSFEQRRDRNAIGYGTEMRRRNAQKLIEGGCTVTVGTDNFPAAASQFNRTPKPIWQEPGIGTLIAIEGLVELGMTPSEAIVAGTRNGALAARGLEDFGTIEVGKYADLLLLEANPLEAISNIHRQTMVMSEGAVIDVKSLPSNPVMFIR